MSTLHLVSILDRSGSMGGSEAEVIGAYNAFITDHKALAAEQNLKIKASLILFDDRYEQVYTKMPIHEVPQLTSETYTVRGMTALRDAISKTIATFEGKKRVIFFIETDGAENASREFSQEALKSLITKKRADGWDFNFVGADLDSFTTGSMAASMGIDSSKTLAFSKSSQGYAARNDVFRSATRAYVNSN